MPEEKTELILTPRGLLPKYPVPMPCPKFDKETREQLHKLNKSICFQDFNIITPEVDGKPAPEGVTGIECPKEQGMAYTAHPRATGTGWWMTRSRDPSFRDALEIAVNDRPFICVSGTEPGILRGTGESLEKGVTCYTQGGRMRPYYRRRLKDLSDDIDKYSKHLVDKHDMDKRGLVTEPLTEEEIAEGIDLQERRRRLLSRIQIEARFIINSCEVGK